MRERIQKLLSLGLPRPTIAASTGCTEGYISQLMAEPEFAESVAAALAANLEAQSTRIDKVENIRTSLLDKLEKTVAMSYKPSDLMTAARTLQTLSEMRTGREGSQLATSAPPTQVVQLNIPTFALSNFTINGNAEITSIDGRNMATMTAAQLQQLAGASNK